MASRVVKSRAWICGGVGASYGSGFQFSVFGFQFSVDALVGARGIEPKTENRQPEAAIQRIASLQRRIVRVLEQFFHLVAHWEIEIDALGRDRGEEPFLI
jgi:hypothetical protein